ncbi:MULTISPECIES: YczI family protein [Bacillaceae]|uniref:YczI family protein n=1 Tax=Evansella alkalicola TaxID=745819 RepID=A0ABS6K0C9_9BACI|nr:MULTISPECIES: YczI family protein [Bacillaceae]MBU9724307.1 YczI family protein [Bacillus alkalicola]
MLVVLKVIFAVIAAFFAGYGLITKNFEFQSYMMFFLSLMVLIIGLEEFRKERKVTGWISIVAFLFVLFASILVFLLN